MEWRRSKCKDDNTCDQPATKGQVEAMEILMGLTLIAVIGNHFMWYAKGR
jgi:hypothetical protein